MITLEKIKKSVTKIALQYPVKRVTLFGSYAEGTFGEDSDVDLIMEFSVPVSLLELSEIRVLLEDLIGINVDIIHGPLQKDDLIEVHGEIELYAA